MGKAAVGARTKADGGAGWRGGVWRIRLSGWVVLLLALLALSDGFSAGAATGQTIPSIISGRVLNGTAGGLAPEGMEVLLLTLNEAAGQIVGRESTRTGAGGRFEFTGVSGGEGLTLRVVANDGAYTPSVDLSGDSDWSNVQVVTYERTKSLDDISVTSYSLLVPSIDARGRSMGVLGSIGLINDGDTVWIPDLSDPSLTGLDLLRFSLPEGYTDLSVESDLPAGNVMEIGTGFALSTPVPPGEFNILVSFLLEYEGNGFDFPLNLPFGGGQVRLILPEGQGSVSGDGLELAETQVVNDRAFTIVTGDGFVRGSRVPIVFADLPGPSLAESVTDYIVHRAYIPILAWSSGALLIGLLGYAMLRSRRKSSATMDARRELVLAIAALDDRYEAGQIDEERYKAEREDLKRRALETYPGPGGGGGEQGRAAPP